MGFTSIPQHSASLSVLQQCDPIATALYHHPSIGVVFISMQGEILLINAVAAKLIGDTTENLIGTQCADLFIDSTFAENIRELQENQWVCNAHHPAKGQSACWDCSMTVWHGQDQQPCGYILLIHEISSFQRAIQQAAQQRELFYRLLDQVPAGIIVVQGEKGLVTIMNATARVLYGEQLREGHTIATDGQAGNDGMPNNDAHPLLLTLRTGRGIRGATCCFQKADGTRVTLQMDCDPLGTFDGESAAIAVLQDITDHAEHERELELQNRRLMKLDREKDTFMTNVSHELKTPLTAILGWAKAGLEMEDDVVARQALQIIERNAQRQAWMIDDLLTLSSCLTGRLTLCLEQVDIRRLCEESIERARCALKDPPIRVILNVKDKLECTADPLRLRQLLDNILTNALKFTPYHGVVSIDATREGEWVRIDVCDTGIGLDKEQLTSMFRPFWQADSSASRKYSGAGIGLTVVKELVALHGGDVSAVSPGLNEGTRFTIRLPRDGKESPGMTFSAGEPVRDV